ncbi:MAG: hypothetical protein ACYSWS_06335 [Planctomycetota bacterium]
MGYGRYDIPQHLLLNQKLDANILIYVIVDITGVRTLKYYGNLSHEYSSSITIKLIDTANNEQIGAPMTSPVIYTPLEVMKHMITSLPLKIDVYWNK